MRRALAVMALVSALFAPEAAAQRFSIHASGDTAFGLVNNQPTLMAVYAQPQSRAATRFRLTFHYDPAKIAIDGIHAPCCSVFYQVIDTSRTATTFSVGASGFMSGTNDVKVFDLRVRLLTGVPDGAFIRTEVDSLILHPSFHPSLPGNQANLASTMPGQMCHATERYGDVDMDSQVDSRDALITLSASIGLPVAGFNLALGDVDGDALANSRDALMMLSFSIGAQINQPNNRTGTGVPDVCPGLTPLAEPIVFLRRGTTRDSLFQLPAGSSTPVYIPGTEDVSNEVGHPRLAGNGQTLVYDCNPVAAFGVPRLCTVNRDGTSLQDVAVPSQFSERADWVPGDTLLAYIANSFRLHRMAPGGAGDVALSNPSFSVRGSVAWNRTGTQIAWTSFTGGLRIINADGTGETVISSAFTDAYIIRWSSAGDSVLFTRSGGEGIYKVSALGGMPLRQLSFVLPAFEEFDVGPIGTLFAVDAPGVRGLWLVPSGGGPLVRVTRGNDHQPSMRRTP